MAAAQLASYPDRDEDETQGFKLVIIMSEPFLPDGPLLLTPLIASAAAVLGENFMISKLP